MIPFYSKDAMVAQIGRIAQEFGIPPDRIARAVYGKLADTWSDRSWDSALAAVVTDLMLLRAEEVIASYGVKTMEK